MPVTIIRTVILYLLVIAAVRLMGKRQIGQMQPTELVVTILLSEIAAVPMQDTETPLLNSVIAVLLLAAFEIIQSAVSLKSRKFRRLFDGSPAVIVSNGEADIKKMRKLRLTADDLSSALRQKDIFDINEVLFAVVETNGTLSVCKKPEQNKEDDEN